MSKEKENCHKKLSTLLNKQDVVKQLNRVKGQIEGIIKMIDKENYCIDIMNQCRAVRGGVYKVEEKLLEAHLKACVVNAIQQGTEGDSQEVIQEILNIYKMSSGKPKS